MGGIKAKWLEDWSQARGLAYVRFDYRGHGASSEAFEDLTLGDWLDDAAEVLARLTDGPQVLVGSSMGGWIALLLARRDPGRLAGIVGIATAADFLVDGAQLRLGEAGLAQMMEQGRVEVPSAYSDHPYVYTRQLYEEAHDHLVFKAPLVLDCPVRLLHGTADMDVPYSVADRLLRHVQAQDAHLTLVKDADHRFSDPGNLALIGAALDDIISR